MTRLYEIEYLRRRIAIRKATRRATFMLEARLQRLVMQQLAAETKPRVRVAAIRRRA